MGGNSVSSGSSRRVSQPTVSPRQKKLETVLKEMRELSPSARSKALSALRKAGQEELADALKALIPAERKPSSGGGSRPVERPSTYVPSGGKR
jgi:hypothetical protein